MTPDVSGRADTRGEQESASSEPSTAWNVLARIIGALGAVGTLLALAALPMPWYTLTNGPTYTGLNLLLANQFAYTGPYSPQYLRAAADPPICMSGVVTGLSLPIGLMVGACAALLLIALYVIWRAPRGVWGMGGALVWVVGGWLACFFLFPWMTDLVNINPYLVHGYGVAFGVDTNCAAPGASDYGQTALQLGLLILCATGLLYGLQLRPSAARLAQVGALAGVAGYLAPANLSPLSFGGILITPSATQVDALTSSLTLIPLALALAIGVFARASQRAGNVVSRGFVAACLVSAPLVALGAALFAVTAAFHPGVVIIGPGVNLLYLCALLLVVAGVRGWARPGAARLPDRAGRRWSEL